MNQVFHGVSVDGVWRPAVDGADHETDMVWSYVNSSLHCVDLSLKSSQVNSET
jgi:hypothetical protein